MRDHRDVPCATGTTAPAASWSPRKEARCSELTYPRSPLWRFRFRHGVWRGIRHCETIDTSWSADTARVSWTSNLAQEDAGRAVRKELQRKQGRGTAPQGNVSNGKNEDHRMRNKTYHSVLTTLVFIGAVRAIKLGRNYLRYPERGDGQGLGKSQMTHGRSSSTTD